MLGLLLALVTGGIAFALVRSEPSGTGAENGGDDGTAELVGPPDETATAEPDATATATARARNCEATESNPGGNNNYIPDAPELESLGEGFVIEGFVRRSLRCERLEDVAVQVWLATETGGERDNRATVRTDADGRYRIQTPPTVAQFGEPNIHVAYEGNEYRPVFIRRVVDLDDRRAVVDLTLTR